MSSIPPPAGDPIGQPPNHLRTLGILLALSTPISGFLLWIVVAVIAGEERLEGESGQTLLGFVVLLTPLVVGVGLAGWANVATSPPTLSRRGVGVLLCGIGVALVLLGVSSVVLASDASIGGGILVLGGLALCAAGWSVLRVPGVDLRQD